MFEGNYLVNRVFWGSQGVGGVAEDEDDAGSVSRQWQLFSARHPVHRVVIRVLWHL